MSARSTQLGASAVGVSMSGGKAGLMRASSDHAVRRSGSGAAPQDRNQQQESNLKLRESYEEHLKEVRAEHASDLRARDMQIEKMRARLERALAEVEEWRRVASEGEVHRRRVSELTEKDTETQARMHEVEEREGALQRQAQILKSQTLAVHLTVSLLKCAVPCLCITISPTPPLPVLPKAPGKMQAQSCQSGVGNRSLHFCWSPPGLQISLTCEKF